MENLPERPKQTQTSESQSVELNLTDMVETMTGPPEGGQISHDVQSAVEANQADRNLVSRLLSARDNGERGIAPSRRGRSRLAAVAVSTVAILGTTAQSCDLDPPTDPEKSGCVLLVNDKNCWDLNTGVQRADASTSGIERHTTAELLATTPPAGFQVINGDVLVTAPNTVIDKKIINGCVEFTDTADGGRIKNSLIRSDHNCVNESGRGGIVVTSDLTSPPETSVSDNVEVSNSVILGTNEQSNLTAVAGSEFSMYASDISKVDKGAELGHNTYFFDNFVHDTTSDDDAAGVLVKGGHSSGLAKADVIGNWIQVQADGARTGAVVLDNEVATSTVNVKANLLDGGESGAAIVGGAVPGAPYMENVKIENNVVADNEAGAWTAPEVTSFNSSGAGNTWVGNVSEAGAPVNAPTPGAIFEVGLPTAANTGYQHTGITPVACPQFENPWTGDYILDGTASPLVVEGCRFDNGNQVRVYGNVTLKSSLGEAWANCDSGCAVFRIMDGAGPVVFQDVEIRAANPALHGGSRQDRWGYVDKNNSQEVLFRRVNAHSIQRGIDISGQENIVFTNSMLGPNINPPSTGVGCENDTERNHASAVRAVGGTHHVSFLNNVISVGDCSRASGLIATYPTWSAANHDIKVKGGLWRIGADNIGGYGIAAGYTINDNPATPLINEAEQQNYGFSVTGVKISTEHYPDGCPSGCGQNWVQGSTANIGPLGSPKVWENNTVYHPGFPDHGQPIGP